VTHRQNPGIVCSRRRIPPHVFYPRRSQVAILDVWGCLFFGPGGGGWGWRWKGGGAKGLPCIIHYALARQAAQAVALWSHSKRALVISLPLGGQLVEQKNKKKRQKLQPTSACSDCSQREGERERVGGLLFGMAGRVFLQQGGGVVVLAQRVQDGGKWGLYRLQRVFSLKEFPHA